MSLPHYERPPVVETILGVQFDPIPGLRTAHLGAFWTLLGSDWATPEDADYLEPQFERFNEGSHWQELALRLRVADHQTRVRVRNTAKDRMIQVQNGRFIFNWLGIEGSAYPRYETIKGEFLRHLDEWKTYLNSTFPGPAPSANQWEVSYLNHIPKGTVWQTPSDWNFCHLWGSHANNAGGFPLESAGAEWHFLVPEKSGRLHIHWHHRLVEDQQEVVRLDLTARGPCTSPALNADKIVEGLDLGRAAIVTTFRDIMDSSSNSYWGLSDAN